MTQTIPSAAVSSAPTKRFEKVSAPAGTIVEATSRNQCQDFNFEDHAPAQPPAPVKHTSIGDLIGQWEQDNEKRATLEEGRQWIADTFYGEDGDTVRTLRLRKGWSQARLATELKTSQSHIARIERGTENLTIETCRKLSKALEVDLNTLDRALRRQEAIA